MQDSYTLHVKLYKSIWRIFIPLFRWLFSLESTMLPQDIESPFLIVANHNIDLDPVLVAASSKEHMYFVSSEHVLRAGVGAWLLRNIFAPIARRKGTTDAAAAMAILRKLRGGANVCLFAEGNRSFDGLTGEIFPATGKMVKAALCTLITFKLEGGYLTSPRWSTTLRRGHMRAYPVRIFTPQQLQQMTAEQINDAIAEDLYEDAYARENKEKIAFKGKKLAEKLETALFICPKCEKLGTLKSKDDELFCTCGMRSCYDELGLLHGATPFSTVTQWDQWQKTKMSAFVNGSERICKDSDAVLKKLGKGKGELLRRGELSLYPYKLCVGDTAFPVTEISDMALAGRNRILYSWRGELYEISGAKAFCGRKYLLFYRLLKGLSY